MTGDRDLGVELAGRSPRSWRRTYVAPATGSASTRTTGCSGQDGYALTWMDARVDGIGITPRIGKAVELNALWIRGLAALQSLGVKTDGADADLALLESRARSSFAARFPTPYGWLHDVVDGPYGDDASLRPNQLLAFSLPDAPLEAVDRLSALAPDLLTPLGLRSLAPDSPAYRGLHEGDSRSRDSAYHQGTVWPWLVGPYAEAHLKVHGDRTMAATFLQPFVDHLADAGLGSISETFDGDAPFTPRGAPAQAWGVAEVLRAWSLVEPWRRSRRSA